MGASRAPAAVVEPARLSPADRAALDALDGAVVVADDGNRIGYVNPAAADLLGRDAEELIGHRLASIVAPELLRPTRSASGATC